MRTIVLATSLGLGVFHAAGCSTRVAASGRNDPPPSTAPATQPGRWTRVRVAEAKDLQVRLISREDPTDHFPVCVVKVYNVSSDDLIVAYEPNCAAVHCGGYEQRGPDVTFVQRREVLSPSQGLELEIPKGGWKPSLFDGGKELLMPDELPAGRYPIWATFRQPGTDSTVVTGDRDFYIVR